MWLAEWLLFWTVVAFQMLGPIVFLVWTWRRTGSWVRVVLGGLVVIPVASFVLGGGILALSTAVRVFVLGVGMTGPDIGMSNAEYVGLTFVTCGGYGVAFSGMGLMLTVPLLGAWFLAHRRSFSRFVAHAAPAAAELGRSVTEGALMGRMTILAAVTTVAGCAGVFASIGLGIGWALGTYSPGYYRSVFRGGNEPWFDPVAVGVGQGLTQGVVGGVVVGLIVVALFMWRDSRLCRQGAFGQSVQAEPGAAPDPAGT